MHKALITLALLPLLGAGCFSAPAPDNEGPYTNEPTPASDEVMTPETPQAEETEPLATQPVVQTPKNSLLVDTQKAGDEVVVKNINVSKPGYVVIQESSDGKPGRIMGSSNLLNAGETKETYVKAEISSDKEYFAVLYTETGDKFFNKAKDVPIEDTEGNIIMMKFGVTK